MLLSRFLREKRKQRIEAAKAAGIAQGKAKAEAKILNEFAERIEAVKGNTKAEAKILNEFADKLENAKSNTKTEAKTLSNFAEQIEMAKAKVWKEGFAEGREKGFAEGKIEGSTEVYAKPFDERYHLSPEWSGRKSRDAKDDKAIAAHTVTIMNIRH